MLFLDPVAKAIGLEGYATDTKWNWWCSKG